MNTTAIITTTVTASLATGAYAYAGMWPTSQIFGATLIAGNKPAEIALTFDDGPNPLHTPHLLDLLDLHNVHATFFLIGDHVRRHPALARETLLRGHSLGNHTQTHPRLLFCSPTRVLHELTHCQQSIADAAGHTPSLFRPPHGARRPDVLRTARNLGLTPVLWNITAADWKPIGPDGILRNIHRSLARNQRHQRGSNLLLHDGSHLDTPTGHGPSRADTLTAVDTFLHSAKALGLRFVTPEQWQAQT